MQKHWASALVAVVMVLISAIVEYLLTGGTSGWVPLVSGLAGVVGGPVLLPRALRLAGLTAPSWSSSIAEPTEQYSQRSPRELIRAVGGKTTIQAEQISKLYVGPRLVVEGTVYDIKHGTEDRATYEVSIEIPGWIFAAPCFAFADFSQGQSASVRSLQKGDTIAVDGRIARIGESFIALEDSRLLPRKVAR